MNSLYELYELQTYVMFKFNNKVQITLTFQWELLLIVYFIKNVKMFVSKFIPIGREKKNKRK